MIADSPRVLLVGNYAPDYQESMHRFARMLRERFCARGGLSVELIAPRRFFGRRAAAHSGLGKWLAYLDKYLLFPLLLRWKVHGLGRNAVVHICDHSNAVYAPAARSAGHVVLVTCHDLGAVRGALGESTDCPASGMGKWLQRWIARSLGRADGIACVSAATEADVKRLIRAPDGSVPETRVILNGLNMAFRPLDAKESAARLVGLGELDLRQPFALNVGSSLRRKNREGVLRIFARIKDRLPGQLVFAGEALPEELTRLAGELGIADRVVQIIQPSDAALEALYCRALALVFPSRFEGFGWPVIEAQACGCPVLCSDAGALGEIAAASAFVRTLADEAAFADELLRLSNDTAARAEWARKGFKNLERFRTETMLDHYAQFYRELSSSS
jgi:glycosyltransferase involved in cell wall biosynthesis